MPQRSLDRVRPQSLLEGPPQEALTGGACCTGGALRISVTASVVLALTLGSAEALTDRMLLPEGPANPAEPIRSVQGWHGCGEAAYGAGTDGREARGSLALKAGALLSLCPCMFASLVLRPMPCGSGAAETLLADCTCACRPKGWAFAARPNRASSEALISPEPLSAVRNSWRLMLPSLSMSIASKSTSVTEPRAAEALLTPPDAVEGRGDCTAGAQATVCRIGDSEAWRPGAGAGTERRGETTDWHCWNGGDACSTAGGGPAGAGDSGAAPDGRPNANDALGEAGEMGTSTPPGGPEGDRGTEPL